MYAPTRLRSSALTALAGVAATVTASLALVGPASAGVPATPSCADAGVTVTGLGGPNFYIDSGSSPTFRSSYTGYRISNGTGAGLGDLWVKLSDFTGGSLALASGPSAALRLGDLADGASGSGFWYLTAAAASASAQNHTVTLYSHNPALPDATPLCTTTGGFSSVQSTIDAAANKVTGISVTGGTPKLGSQFTVTVTGETGTIGAGITGDSQSLWMSPAVSETWPADAFRLIGTSLTISPDGSAAAQTYPDVLRKAGLGSTARSYTASYTFRAVGFTTSSTTVKPVQEIASGTQVKHTGNYSVSLPAIPPPTNDLSLSLTSDQSKLDLGGGYVKLTGTPSGTSGAELDALLMTLPTGATLLPGSARWAGQVLPDPVVSGANLVFSGPFVVGDGTLQVKVQLDGTPGKRRVTLLGAIGSARIGNAPTPIDGSNPAVADVDVNGAPEVTDRTIETRPGTPVTTNVASMVTDVNDDAWTITGTGPAQHGSVSVDDRLVTYTPADSEYVGEDSFTVTVADGRGGTATATVHVDVNTEATPTLIDQSIHFVQPDDLLVGGGESLDVTASSELAVEVSSLTPEVCVVEGSTVTALSAGECTLEARQDGDGSFAPAEPVTRTLTVSVPEEVVPEAQTITFAPPASVLGTSPLALDGTASSGLPVSYSALSGDCSVDGPVDGSVDGWGLTGTGTCVVEASQDGDETHAAAEPVSASVTFVVAADDELEVAGNSSGVVDVLANDPEGVALDEVAGAAHGTTAIVDDQVSYTPATGYRGPDSFTYTVSDGHGRTSQAQVDVTVDNLGPALAGANVSQVAGTSRSITLVPTDPNGDPVTLSAVSASPYVGARVTGNVLTLSASSVASGVVPVTVTATDSDGASVTATVTTVVTPVAPTGVKRTLGALVTRISWTAAPTAGARYEVVVDGRLACSTTATGCRLLRIVGPQMRVQVRTLGRDGTRSSQVAAPLSGHGQVLIRTVYFDSGSAALTRADRRTLRAAIRTIHRIGFAHAWLDGYTDADGGIAFNLALSHRRTHAVAAFLRSRGDLRSTKAWYGESDPVASNDGAHGKSRNRRVEVLVRY
jgi:outer membrane protein OmpA-like peptidoglycan-associated protein